MERGKEKWVKCMRDRLDNYAEQVPEGAWEALEQELSSSTLASPWGWKRVASVAAVVLVAFASVGVWLSEFPKEQHFQQIATSTKKISDVSKRIEMDAIPLLKPETPAAQTRHRNCQETFTKNDKLLADGTLPLEDSVEEPVETISIGSDTLSASERQTSIAIAKKPHKSSANADKKYNMNIRHAKQKKNNWGIGVMYANSLGVKNSAFPGYSTLNFADFSQVNEPLHDDVLPQVNKVPQKAPIPAYNKSELPKTEIKHKLPVTAGVSFRYYINSRFAVETGLNYTMLSSELRAGTHDEYYIEEYKFHYLGIPLKASWTFWDIPYLSLYVSAGGEMEKSLAGKYKKQYVSKDEDVIVWNDNIKPMQWSLLGSLGIQLKLNSHVGIYAEPGVVYYFDDGSKVQTIRKEKPLNFKMQLGIRWTY